MIVFSSFFVGVWLDSLEVNMEEKFTSASLDIIGKVGVSLLKGHIILTDLDHDRLWCGEWTDSKFSGM